MRRGTWNVSLAPLAASATPAELMVTGGNGKTVRITNVLVGEVWLCAGQSNMGFRMSRSLTAKEDIAAARYPLLRQFDVPTLSSDAPCMSFERAWIGTTPETVRLSEAGGLHLRQASSGGAEIAGADRVFHPATIRVEGGRVVLSPAHAGRRPLCVEQCA